MFGPLYMYSVLSVLPALSVIATVEYFAYIFSQEQTFIITLIFTVLLLFTWTRRACLQFRVLWRISSGRDRVTFLCAPHCSNGRWTTCPRRVKPYHTGHPSSWIIVRESAAFFSGKAPTFCAWQNICTLPARLSVGVLIILITNNCILISAMLSTARSPKRTSSGGGGVH